MQRSQKYHSARSGKEDLVVVDGLHAIKHAARFDAHFDEIVTADKKALLALAQTMIDPTDIRYIDEHVMEIPAAEFLQITGGHSRTGIIGLAHKSNYKVDDIKHNRAIVFLEDPHDGENVGAVVRLAAGFGAGAVVVTGAINPWHTRVIRTAAGLQWALPVLHVETLEEVVGTRNVYACDDQGDSLYEQTLACDGVYIFGTERHGISQHLQDRADQMIALPMQPGVSSLNLATSVAGVLYGSNCITNTK